MNEREIFAAALEKRSAAERATFLDGACGTDAALRERVEVLLSEQENLGSFLESPHAWVAADAAATVEPPASERPGTQIGPYKLLQQIGEGGFGIVFMAEQVEPVRRRVALKGTTTLSAVFTRMQSSGSRSDGGNLCWVFKPTLPVLSQNGRRGRFWGKAGHAAQTRCLVPVTISVSPVPAKPWVLIWGTASATPAGRESRGLSSDGVF